MLVLVMVSSKVYDRAVMGLDRLFPLHAPPLGVLRIIFNLP